MQKPKFASQNPRLEASNLPTTSVPGDLYFFLHTYCTHMYEPTQTQRHIIKDKSKVIKTKYNTIKDYTAIKRTNACCNTNRSGEHYAKSKKPVTVAHTLYDFIRNVQNKHIYGSRKLSEGSVPLEQINEE